MKVFISQPMRDRPQEAIELERSLVMAEMRLRFGEGEVVEIPSYSPSLAPVDPVYSLGQSIKMMSEADVVYFCSGWEEARGCKIEHAVAEAYDLPIMYSREYMALRPTTAIIPS